MSSGYLVVASFMACELCFGKVSFKDKTKSAVSRVDGAWLKLIPFALLLFGSSEEKLQVERENRQTKQGVLGTIGLRAILTFQIVRFLGGYSAFWMKLEVNSLFCSMQPHLQYECLNMKAPGTRKNNNQLLRLKTLKSLLKSSRSHGDVRVV